MGIFDRSSVLTQLQLTGSSAEPHSTALTRASGLTTLNLRTNPLENPSIPLNAALVELFGGYNQTESGEFINESNALGIVTVYSCVHVISEAIGQMPVILMERTDKGAVEAFEQNLHHLLSVEPNPDMGAQTFFESLAGSTALTGNGYAQIERNNDGAPVALWLLHPQKTVPVRDKATGALMYQTSVGMDPGQYRLVSQDDMIHVKLFSLDGILGISPIEANRHTLGLAKAQEKAGARLFANGSTPPTILINKTGKKPEPKIQQELTQSWQEQYGGSNQGKTALMFGDWDVKQLALSNEAAQWLQSRNFSQAQIAGMFKVPPHLVGDTSRLSGSNSEQTDLQFLKYCLTPYLNKIEGELVRKLMPRFGRKANRFFVRFNTEELTRCDFKSQMEGFGIALDKGIMSSNEVRRKLGMNPGGPELDVFTRPLNFQNATALVNAETEIDKPLEVDDADVQDVDSETQAERNLFAAYRKAYFPLYRDAFQRLMKRSRRDTDTFNAVFRAVLDCISGMAVDFRQSSIDTDTTEKVVTDVLKGMAKRAVKWPSDIAEQELQSLIENEFGKVVRALHIEISKAEAVRNASREVLNTDGKPDE